MDLQTLMQIYQAIQNHAWILVAFLSWPVLTGILDAVLVPRLKPNHPKLAAGLEKVFTDIDGLLATDAAKKAAGLVAGVFLGLLVVLCAGCAGQSVRDTAVDSINAATDLARTTETELATMYRVDEDMCVIGPGVTKASAESCIAGVQKRYAPAWQAYRDMLAARLAAASAVQIYDDAVAAGKKPSFDSVASLVVVVGDDAARFAAAIQTLKGN